MFYRYLQIAWRNILRYKIQNVISVLSLTIGFTFFLLSVIWLHYENSFDTFHPNADRIYTLLQIDDTRFPAYNDYVDLWFCKYLKDSFPEVEATTGLWGQESLHFKKEDLRPASFFDSHNSLFLYYTDTSFIHVFGLQQELVKTFQPIKTDTISILITEKARKKLWGDSVSIGRTSPGPFPVKQVKGVINSWNKRSGLYLDALILNNLIPLESGGNLFVLLKEGADVEVFEQKIKAMENDESLGYRKAAFEAIPIAKLHKVFPTVLYKFKYKHIQIFAIGGILLFVCALVNFLTLFLSRLSRRGQELKLYLVNGSSSLSLNVLLLTEYFILLFLSVFLGICLLEFISPCFVKIVRMNDLLISELYPEILFGTLMLLIIIVLFFTPFIFFLSRKVISDSLNNKKYKNAHNFYLKLSLLFQFIVSLCFIFTASVFYLQIDYLRYGNLGFRTKNIYTVKAIKGNSNYNIVPFVLEHHIPGVEMLILQGSFFPWSINSGVISLKKLKGDFYKDSEYIYYYNASPDFFDFMEIRLLEGRIYKDGEKKSVIINEAAYKILDDGTGLIGKKIDGHLIVGVVENSYTNSPLSPVVPIFFREKGQGYLKGEQMRDELVLKADNGIDKNKIREEIEIILSKKKTGMKERVFINHWAEAYDFVYISSELNLMFFFRILSMLCIIISLFGVYSLLELICNQKRKEVAIRKINGARLIDLLMFLMKDYYLLLFVAALVAFPVATFFVTQWLKKYSRIVPLTLSLYIVMFFVVAIVVGITVIGRIWRTSRANPADEIRKE